MIESTMQEFPLGIQHLFNHGRRVHADSEVITWTADGPVHATFEEVGDRADRLAAALAELGVGSGTRVGTFAWNNQHHMEAYLAVPSMGAVLHTLNIRLFPEQLAYVINHAEDEVIIVDSSIAPLLAKVREQLTTVRHIISIGDGDTSGLGETLDYEATIGAHEPASPTPRSTSGRRPPCVTQRDHGETRRVLRIRTARRISTRSVSRQPRRWVSARTTDSCWSCPCSMPTHGGCRTPGGRLVLT